MSNNYVLHYSKDDIKSPLLLQPRTINRASSSIVLTGRGVQDYGTDTQENLLHMLENFCSDISPVSPTEGQLWYNTNTKVFLVCIGFVKDPLKTIINAADPNDQSYLRDINGARIPIWKNVVGSNGTGNKTISTLPPSGGVDGDIWYQI